LKAYRKILLTLELDSVMDRLPIEKTMALAEECEAELFLLHVIEHLGSYGAAYGVAAGADIESIIMNRAHKELRETAKTLGVAEDRLLFKQGSGASAILEESTRLGIDLIVVGSHARHGMSLIVGSTADGVVTRARCDVLAVRLED
jgi:universal stress protein A